MLFVPALPHSNDFFQVRYEDTDDDLPWNRASRLQHLTVGDRGVDDSRLRKVSVRIARDNALLEKQRLRAEAIWPVADLRITQH